MRAPFAPMVLALIVGILAARWGAPAWMPAALAAVAGASALLIYFPRFWRAPAARLARTSAGRGRLWWCVLPLFAAAGYFCMTLHSTDPDAVEGRSFPYKYASGTVMEAQAKSGGDRLTVRVETLISFRGESVRVAPFSILVSTPGTLAREGDIVTFRCDAQRLRNEDADPETGYAELMYARGMEYRCHVPEGRLAVTGHDGSWRFRLLEWRDAVEREIELTPLRPGTKALLLAMLTGDRDYITPQTRADFTGAGLAHILALSGLHVGIIMALLLWLLLPLNALGLRNLRYALTAVGIALFALMTGLGVSVARAAIMGCCFLLAMAMERRRTGLNVLCAAAFLILMFDPLALFDAGFRLSFAVALGIMLFAQDVTPFARKKTHRLHALIGWVVVPLVAFMVAWPLTASYFHAMPLLFLPLNLLFVPALPAFMLGAMLYIGLFALGVALTPLGAALDWFCEAMLWSARLAGSHSVPVWVPEAMPWLYLAALGLLAYYVASERREALWGAVMFGLCALLSLFVLPTACPPDSLRLRPEYSRTELTEYVGGRRVDTPLARDTVLMLRASGHSVAWVDMPLAEADTASPKIKCDVLVAGPEAESTLTELLAHFEPDVVAVHAGTPQLREARMQTEADTLPSHVAVHFLNRDGALILPSKRK